MYNGRSYNHYYRNPAPQEDPPTTIGKFSMASYGFTERVHPGQTCQSATVHAVRCRVASTVSVPRECGKRFSTNYNSKAMPSIRWIGKCISSIAPSFALTNTRGAQKGGTIAHRTPSNDRAIAATGSAWTLQRWLQYQDSDPSRRVGQTDAVCHLARTEQ